MTPNIILLIGIGILAGTAGLCVVSFIILHLEKKRVQHQLEKEYGKWGK